MKDKNVRREVVHNERGLQQNFGAGEELVGWLAKDGLKGSEGLMEEAVKTMPGGQIGPADQHSTGVEANGDQTRSMSKFNL